MRSLLTPIVLLFAGCIGEIGDGASSNVEVPDAKDADEVDRFWQSKVCKLFEDAFLQIEALNAAGSVAMPSAKHVRRIS